MRTFAVCQKCAYTYVSEGGIVPPACPRCHTTDPWRSGYEPLPCVLSLDPDTDRYPYVLSHGDRKLLKSFGIVSDDAPAAPAPGAA